MVFINNRNSIRRFSVGTGVGLTVFAAGFAFSPALPQAAKALTAPICLAAAGNVQLGVLIPLPEEEQSPSRARDINASMPPIETYSKVIKKLEDSYYQSPGTERELTYAAIRGMLSSLGDRYTRFLDPNEFRRMQQENEGEFGGIGAKLERAQGKTVIKEVVPNSPASKSALKAGDAVLDVDGKSAVGISILKVVDMIRGQKGTPVKLTLERKGIAKPFVKTLTRDTIKLPTVIAEMILGPDKKPTGTARIELTQFNQLAHTELDAALLEMQKKGMKGLVFDLRNNPGGLLSEAVAVGSRFVESGPIVLIKRGDEMRQMNVERTRNRYRGPLVVLVNKFSASASEIVAGAVKDTNRGVLVGTDTWGKGLVQTITPIREDGSAVLITTHKYLTPNKIDINKKGIAPLYKVTMTREDVEKKRDPQLDKAVAILKGETAKDATAKAPIKAP